MFKSLLCSCGLVCTLLGSINPCLSGVEDTGYIVSCDDTSGNDVSGNSSDDTGTVSNTTIECSCDVDLSTIESYLSDISEDTNNIFESIYETKTYYVFLACGMPASGSNSMGSYYATRVAYGLFNEDKQAILTTLNFDSDGNVHTTQLGYYDFCYYSYSVYDDYHSVFNDDDLTDTLTRLRTATGLYAINSSDLDFHWVTLSDEETTALRGSYTLVSSGSFSDIVGTDSLGLDIYDYFDEDYYDYIPVADSDFQKYYLYQVTTSTLGVSNKLKVFWSYKDNLSPLYTYSQYSLPEWHAMYTEYIQDVSEVNSDGVYTGYLNYENGVFLGITHLIYELSINRLILAYVSAILTVMCVFIGVFVIRNFRKGTMFYGNNRK